MNRWYIGCVSVYPRRGLGFRFRHWLRNVLLRERMLTWPGLLVCIVVVLAGVIGITALADAVLLTWGGR